MNKKQIISRLIAITLMVSVIATLCGCNDKTITGTWKGSLNDVEYTFTFNEDGSGTEIINAGTEIKLNFEYTKEDKNSRIIITKKVLTETQEYTYSFSVKKDTLTMTGDNEEYILSKVN